MCSVVIKGLRFADTQESCFEPWKRSHMGCSALLFGQFADSQESRFQVSKRSDMVNAVMKGLRFSDTQESCFEDCKRSHMACSALLCVDLLILRNRVFRL